jgi:hypothetical protein
MTRTEVINLLIEKNSYKHYLEIGIDNPANNFNKIKIEDKTGVDPYDQKLRVATHWNDGNKEVFSKQIQYVMTSDDFFRQNTKKFDIVFIDGLHLDHQVRKDIENSLKFLNENGTIVLHDCLPERYEGQLEKDIGYGWWGTVWKTFALFRITRNDLIMKTIDTDCGLGIIKKGEQKPYELLGNEGIEWSLFQTKRNELMNVITAEEFKKSFNEIK